MAERKRMSDVARKFSDTKEKFIKTGEVDDSASAETESNQPKSSSLRQELLGEETEAEPSVRFTVDMPRSLHRRLDQLSIDSGKPKTELVRIMIRRALDDIAY